MCRQMFRDIDAECYLMVDGDDTYPCQAAKSLYNPHPYRRSGYDRWR